VRRSPGLSLAFWFCACLSLLGCSPGPRVAGETELAGYVPADTIALAGIDLERIRNSDLQRFLPPLWLAALGPFQEANLAWLSYNGRDLLVIAHGHFSSPPPGAVLVTRQLALGGSSLQVRAATRQQATHQIGVPRLIAQASPVVDQPIWAVIRGDARLPLSGNAANLNRMLRFTQYLTVAVNADIAVRINLTGHCATQENARHLEESLRALITLAAAATRTPDLAALLKSVQIDRDVSTVHVNLQASQTALRELFRQSPAK
jgi:hypothetical protein